MSQPAATFEQTVIIPPLPAGFASAGTSMGDTQIKPRMEMVTGSRRELAMETRHLLQGRLRAVAIILFVATSLFYVRGLFVPDSPVRMPELAVVLTTGLAIVVLSRVRTFSLTQLRTLELTLFGMMSLFLAVYQYIVVRNTAMSGDAVMAIASVKSCVLYVFAVIVLYGTFIPNTWRRAACVVIPMTLVPPIVTVLLRSRHAAVQELANRVVTFEVVSDNLIMLVVGAIIAVYGTHIINTLRVEVYQARQLGQYRLKERIGAGGMGEVYLAEHQLLKRPCAIKLIHPHSQADPGALARFEREVRAAARLSHWNTVHIFDYGRTDDGTFYYVMEYLPGLNLADLVAQHGPLPPGRAIHLLRQTCDALHEAHLAGLIHRDIKPANIIASQRGGRHDVAKLLDFGLVAQTGPVGTLDHQPQVGRSGGVSGSPLYMSPEQAVAETEPDGRSDIYSLGATAYFLLTGKNAFERDNVLDLLRAHTQDPVPRPSEICRDFPPDLERVILRCLEKQPDNRYATVESLNQALAGCAAASTWSEETSAEWWETHQSGTPALA